jgi:alkylation response protein AidB-like acyl-CoA dehydrogenase
MSVELTEIQESARQIANDIGIAASEEKTWPLIVELGLLQVCVPEDLGGLGQGLAGASALHRELGASLASGPYLASMLAIDALTRSDLADKAQWIERATTGEYIATALADGDLVVTTKVSGTASAVPSADTASHILVYGGDVVALVAREQKGVQLTSRPTFDGTRRLFDVGFDNVAVDSKLTLARGAAAKSLMQRMAAQRDFALAGDSVGGAAALLNMTVEYLQSRRQFGRPLALFQALKHRCADLKMQTEAAHALLLDGISRAESNEADAERAGRMAKQLACSVYAHVGEEALQLHGGIGMTSEHSLHLFLKRALLNEHLGRHSDSYELEIAADFLSTLSPSA